jgi:hypothetical protein
MRKCLSVSLIAALALLTGGPARADDQADIKALLAKAIKALGGEDKLSKEKVFTAKFKGKFYMGENGIDYTMELFVQFPGQAKSVISFEVNGMAFTVVSVLNKDKGWVKIGNDTMDLDKDRLAEEKEKMYARSLEGLVMLKDKAYTLATVGEVKVGKHDAVGIKVSSKGHRDVNLFFDKKTGLLVKTETMVKKEGTDTEVSQEVIYEAYKEIDGIKRPMKLHIKQDGKKYVDVDETTEFKVEEKLDDSTFDKP